jgi:CRP/FNR family transcriptional regulator, cyclic AMP receptor protein
MSAQFRIWPIPEGRNYRCCCFRQKEVFYVSCSPTRWFPSQRKIARQTPTDPASKIGRRTRVPSVAAKKKRAFDPHSLLATIGAVRKFILFAKGQTIFAQGDPSDAVFYIQTGKIRLTAVSTTGKEATIGMLGEGDFFGEGSLAGQAFRMGSATAMTDCAVLRIDKQSMMKALHREHAFSHMFVAYLLARNIRYEEDLVDQLFNPSEKRLARVLLLLAHFGKEGKPEGVVPDVSQQMLAEMIGTTRPRVSFFMNRFRKLGFIHTTAGCRSTARC